MGTSGLTLLFSDCVCDNPRMAETDIPTQVNGTATQDSAVDPEAPYGWMTDPVTKELRPRKKPGARKAAPPRADGSPPSLEELRAAGPAREQEEKQDRAPGGRASLRRGRRRSVLQKITEPKPADELPPFRAGPLAKAVNKLYRRIGRILKMIDHDMGIAVLACTRKEEEDDVTVGEAWEELARTNPRVRAFLLRLTTGGAVASLLEAHLPILLALVMKDAIRRHIPFMRLIEAWAEEIPGDEEDEDDQEDEDGSGMPAGLGKLFSGLTPEDMAQMHHVANSMAAQMAAKMPRTPAASAERAPVVDAPPGGGA